MKTIFSHCVWGVVLLLGGVHYLHAEGTGTINQYTGSTYPSHVSSLLVAAGNNFGPTLNCSNSQKIYVRVNSTSERIYCGFRFFDYENAATSTRSSNVYIRVYRPDGTVLSTTQLPTGSSSAGNINNYNACVQGPNALRTSGAGGYTPLTLTPTTTGLYSIRIYRSSNGGGTEISGTLSATTASFAPLWDITVGIPNTTAANRITYNGRVFCGVWGLVATDVTQSGSGSNVTMSSSGIGITAVVNPRLYAYANNSPFGGTLQDNTLMRITFNGVAPLGYSLAVTQYGIYDNGNWLVDRQSVNNPDGVSPNLEQGHMLFLNVPDSTLYPITTYTAKPSLANPALTGIAGNYNVNFNMPYSGDIDLLVDVNNDGVYTPGTTDRHLEFVGLPSGFNSVPWDGNDGLGNPVVNNTSVKLLVTAKKGRFNVPLFDAEANQGGIQVATMTDVTTAVANRLYWDDSTQIAPFGSTDNNDNITGKGHDNSVLGTLTDAGYTHQWYGDADNNAPSNTSQYYRYFGNSRTINSWGWAVALTNDIVSSAPIAKYTISGQVYNDGNGKTDNLTNTTGTSTSLPTSLYIKVLDASNALVATIPVQANGTYSVDYSGIASSSYSLVLSNSNNSTITPSLPTGWVNVGEAFGYAGALSNYDPTVDGKLTNLTLSGNSNVLNVNFAINRVPATVEAQVKTLVNQPNVNASITLDNTIAAGFLSGTDPEYGAIGSGGTFKILDLSGMQDNELWYNGTQITGPTTISNYDPTKLSIKFVKVGSTGASFSYAPVDSAGITAVLPSGNNYSLLLPYALPVTLQSFTGVVFNSQVRLDWTTSSEINVDRFEIERSYDNGKSWTKIGQVKAVGNSSALQKYTFADTSPLDKNLYRLKTVDTDLYQEYSKKYVSVNLNSESNGPQVKITPNPADEEARLVFSSPLISNTTVTIYDLAGKNVRSFLILSGQQSYPVNIAGLPSGTYVVSLKDEENRYLSVKMVVK